MHRKGRSFDILIIGIVNGGMHPMWRKNENRIFRRYFIMYFCVLLVPMIICCSYYAYMLLVINSDDIAARKNDLLHAASRFDVVASEIEYLGDCLVSNVEVNKFKNLKDVMVYPNTHRIHELQASLPDLHLVNQAVYDYFLLFDHSEAVINPSIAYTYEQFYSLYMSKQDVNGFDLWKTELKKNGNHYGFLPMEEYHMRKFHAANQKKNLIAYTRPIAVFDIAETGYVYIFLDDHLVESILPVPEDHSIQVIQDFSGNILYCSDEGDPDEGLTELLADLDSKQLLLQKKVKVRGTKYMLISYRSETSGLRYSCFVPNDIINERLTNCIYLLIFFLVLGLFADVALSYYISKKNAVPINDILNKMSINTESLDVHDAVFSSIVQTVNDLVENNEDLSNAINLQKPYLKTAFTNRLLYSGYQNDKEIVGMADYLNWPWENRLFCVLIFRFHTMTDWSDGPEHRFFNTFAASLSELIEKKMPGSLFTDIGEGQFALIMNVPDDNPEGIKVKSEELVSYIKSEMTAVIAQKVFVYGGSIEKRADRIVDSYQNVSYLCYNEACEREDRIIWYSEGGHHSVGYPSADMQVKLTHFVTSGDEAGLHDYLENIVREYFVEKDLPVYMQHILVTELQIILFRLLGIIKLEDSKYAAYYAQLEKNVNMPVLNQITITLNLFRDTCRYMNRQKNVRDGDMIANGIISYIDARYGDPNLSLALLADQFEISQPYLSSLFKQTQGINLSTYIENIRIEKAKDFLRTTDLTIGKISEMVGYGSTNSFCRAFKRVTGVSTSEYRKQDSLGQESLKEGV